ncbi:MAG: Gfo/Idh/MocA family oxidoreductase [Verrucomicrobiota bacterium]
MPDTSRTDRRAFLKTTSTAGFAAASSLACPPVATAQEKGKKLKVGLIGCGGRGTGAASQALKADDNIELTAVADVFPGQVERSLQNLSKLEDKVNVAEGKRFVGLDAYKEVLDSDIDVAILATPPGFRPAMLKAAVNAGKHIFCEKPMAVDVPGVRSVMESVKIAKEKNLCLVAGFCWRYSTSRKAAFDQVANGLIGDITSYYATYYTGPVKPMPPKRDRPDGMSDVEWQVKNWYNFTWTCGDGLVEQAVHSVDKIGWAMGDMAPVAALASGGRNNPNGEGNIFDHFNVTYEFPNNLMAFMASRQTPKCFNENADFIMGTNGQCVIGKGARPFAIRDGKRLWRFSGDDNDMYQAEHDVLFDAIRKDKVVNDGDRMINSTMMAILGREAAYTGVRITWEDAMKSELDLAPDDMEWNGSFEPTELARPGVTKFV